MQRDADAIERFKKDFMKIFDDLKCDMLGNKTLREKLGWDAEDKDLFWDIRDLLIDDGKVVRGMGKGGSTILVPEQTSAPSADLTPVANNELPDGAGDAQGGNAYVEAGEAEGAGNVRENSLYQYIVKSIKDKWYRELGMDNNCIVEVTASAGARPVGMWARPDVVVVGCKSYPYIPGRELEVTAIEVKLAKSFDVGSVHQAMAQRGKATKAYVMVFVGEAGQQEDDPMQNGNAIEEAKKYGIGIIVVENVTDSDTWEIKLSADRVLPNKESINGLMASLPETSRNEILKLIK